MEPNFYMYDSTDRCAAFIDYIQSFDAEPATFWRLLSDLWSTFDLIDHDKIEWLMQYFTYKRAFLSDDCRKSLRKLRGQDLVIYRGQSGDREPTGLAWTTSRSVAEQFARMGFRGFTQGAPHVLEARIHRREIAMAFNDRDEKEVVPFCFDALRSVKAIEL